MGTTNLGTLEANITGNLTGAADFTSISAGSMTLEFFYLT